jgi:deoxyribodipyrimidine photo-lyase
MALNRSSPILVWFRRDLRLEDNPALAAAAKTQRPLLAIYILDEDPHHRWSLGAASRWWLHHSLAALARALSAKGLKLILLRGPAERELAAVISRSGAHAVYWNRCYEPVGAERDSKLASSLALAGVETKSFNAGLLFEPWTIRTKTGDFYRIFTPFWKACLTGPSPGKPATLPKQLAIFEGNFKGDDLPNWELLPDKPDWAGGLRTSWTPGEASAHTRLEEFVRTILPKYARDRDLPAVSGTSRLSPHLHFGEISSRQIWYAATHGTDRSAKPDRFLSELGWREFSYHLLFHCPALPERNLKTEFDQVPWLEDSQALRAWQAGQTGYPMVDAGMRELWHTGWMHNRVRMVTASFLVKHLLLPWQIGAAWFWDTLVDADLANNSANWQWVAGSGVDAAPYFRILNPVLQGERFDPEGSYVRKWVPELRRLPNHWIHKPWMAPQAELADAGLSLGKTYPRPIIDHHQARQRALTAFSRIKLV